LEKKHPFLKTKPGISRENSEKLKRGLRVGFTSLAQTRLGHCERQIFSCANGNGEDVPGYLYKKS
jgi:hypothetical protein